MIPSVFEAQGKIALPMFVTITERISPISIIRLSSGKLAPLANLLKNKPIDRGTLAVSAIAFLAASAPDFMGAKTLLIPARLSTTTLIKLLNSLNPFSKIAIGSAVKPRLVINSLMFENSELLPINSFTVSLYALNTDCVPLVCSSRSLINPKIPDDGSKIADLKD